MFCMAAFDLMEDAHEIKHGGIAAGPVFRVERQRWDGAPVARALAVEPQLIFYDEPASGLDPISSVEIAEDIVKLNERVHATSLVVSHDRDLAFGIAGRIAVLEDSRILAVGTPDEIKRNSNPTVQSFLNASIAQMRTMPRQGYTP
jgi:ABC-type transporter Mla maintaining outer membrane lipid asymmetry ATPase subunit MlaF